MIRTTQPLDREDVTWHNISVMASEVGRYQPGWTSSSVRACVRACVHKMMFFLFAPAFYVRKQTREGSRSCVSFLHILITWVSFRGFQQARRKNTQPFHLCILEREREAAGREGEGGGKAKNTFNMIAPHFHICSPCFAPSKYETLRNVIRTAFIHICAERLWLPQRRHTQVGMNSDESGRHLASNLLFYSLYLFGFFLLPFPLLTLAPSFPTL